MVKSTVILVLLMPCVDFEPCILVVSSLSIAKHDGVVIGRPFTLECTINRTVGNRDHVNWQYYGRRLRVSYSARECIPSIPVRVSFVGEQLRITGGCNNINGEEVHAVHIDNITENMIDGRWNCRFGNESEYITLILRVPVTSVTLTKSLDTVRAGDHASFTCVSSASKPQACIRAYIRSSGNVRELDPRKCNQDTSSVQTTNRTLTFTASAEENGAELYCNASNSVMDPPVRSRVYTLSVQYPPQSGMLLSGYVNNTAVETGETLTLTCRVGQGNPRPTLTWSSGCGQTNTVPGNDGSQQIRISIAVSPSLNQKECVCEGSQDGMLTRWTEQESRTFNVTFGPGNAHLEADPRQLDGKVSVAENNTVTFTCTSGESNPAAVLSWYNNSSPVSVEEISEVISRRGLNHGYLTTQRYKVRADRDQDDNVIRCEAQRPGQAALVLTSLVLDIMYAPDIICNSTHAVVLEGQEVNLSCEVKSNPTPSIVWQKGIHKLEGNITEGYPHPNKDAAMIVSLILSSAAMEQSGIYHLSATNVIGTATKDITIRVVEFIPATIKVVSCKNGQASLIWASGLDESVLQYYKLEYRGTQGAWEAKLVKNPGNLKLVETTLNGLNRGVTYQFRIKPNSSVALSENITSECTVLADDSGQGKMSMLAVGLGVGGSVVGLGLFVVVGVFLRRGVFFWQKSGPPQRSSTDQNHESADQNHESTDQNHESTDQNHERYSEINTENPSHTNSGTYEALPMRPIAAAHYEEILLRKVPPTGCSGPRMYENVTVLNIPH